MALEWIVLWYAAGAEAIMVLLLTLPGVDCLRKGLIAVTRNLLKPFLSVIPFCLFLLIDIYWKYETRPSCESPDSCAGHALHQEFELASRGRRGRRRRDGKKRRLGDVRKPELEVLACAGMGIDEVRGVGDDR
ncbi:hypothetical protein CsSME_00003655 [Camellia sinensis var. sinensis]